MTTRDTRIACDKGTFVKTSVQTVPMVDVPSAQRCVFELTTEQYGNSSAIRGVCVTHGGHLLISLRVQLARTRKALTA